MQQLQTVAASNPNHPAVYNLGKIVTYRELLTDIARLSYLYQHDIGHEPRVAFFTTNHVAMIKTFFALTNIKGVCIPLDPQAPPEELAAWIKNSGATHIAVTSDTIPKARELMSSERIYLPTIEIEKKRGGEYDTSFTPQPDKEPREDDTALLLRTGANVAQDPMLVEINHRQLIYAATSLRSRYKISKTDRILTQMNWAHPFSFIHGLIFPLMVGATVVIDQGFSVEGLIEFFLESRTTRLIGHPKYFRKLLLVCKEQETKLPPTIKSVIAGLGPLSEPLRRAFGLMKINVQQVYGQTENAWTIAMEDAEPPPEGETHAFRPLPGFKYKVLDQAGDEIEGDESRVGRLAVMSPTIMQKYSGPEAQKKELEDATRKVKRGTWLYTGDIARLDGRDDDLKISYLGREVDAYFREGQVHLADGVDSLLKEVKGLKEGAGFFMENAVGKTIMACAVVRMPKVQLSDQEILKILRGALGDEAAPRVVFFTDSIPRDLAGNVNRYRLRRQFNGTMTG